MLKRFTTVISEKNEKTFRGTVSMFVISAMAQSIHQKKKRHEIVGGSIN
jgi:hypothetical protein